MKQLSFLILTLFGMSTFLLAQNPAPDTLAQAKLEKLSFMAGKWSGSGWMYNQNRERMTFDQTEDIRFKLAGTTLLIEGVGTSEGEIVHNALAVVSYNKKAGHYDFQSYLQNGQSGTFKAEIIDDKLYWYPSVESRFIISINEKGQWYERGEFNAGGNWFQFFEMTLNKTD